ncbi:MAG: hypothetical protein ACERKV_03005 [Clostridiaceae bacterium]
MTLEEIKVKWNENLRRIKKAEKTAEDKPEVFMKFMSEFHRICRVMSNLMYEYKCITGEEIAEQYFEREFEI